MATIQDLGKVAYLNKGVYNSETTYEINDVVSFNGSSYVSKTNENRGNLPTNTIYWSIVASKGDKGETGKPFVIEKTYMTIEAMVADYDNMNINDYVMISGNIEEEQNATLWTKTANEVSPYKWEYLADFSGASGITGATPNIIIGNVTEGNQPAVTRRAGSSNENPILDFILKTGPKGDIGDTGNGISSIEKTGTSGLVDTYTITYTDGTTSTFQVTNGEDAEITPEEFEELQNEVNELKDENQRLKETLPTTTGTGENITLNKTAEMEFVVPPLPEGNTKQNTRQGYNLVNEDNLEVFNNNRYVKFNDNYYINVEPNTAYTLSIEVFAGDGKFVEYDENNNILKESSIYSIFTNGYITITTTADTKKIKFYAQMYGSTPSTTPTKYTARCLLVEGSYTSSSLPDYEPYGASPSPDYPQEVQVVKGDVEVKVENENFADNDKLINGYMDSNGEWVNANEYRSTALIEVKEGKTYIAGIYNIAENRLGSLVWTTYDENENFVSQILTETITIPTGIKYIRARNYQSQTSYIINNDFLYKVEPGSTATPYTPHQEQTLPLNLPVENLWSLNNSYSSTTGNQWVLLDTAYHLDAGTYTISFDATVNKTVQFNFKDANNDSYAVNVGTNATFTTAVPLEKVAINITSANNTISNIQIEPGLKANHYTPYGTTPIELCKIGDYKDYPWKDLTNGKWYWHKVIGKEILDRNNYLSRGDTGTNAYYLSINIEGLNNNNIIVSYSNMFQPCAFVDRANGKDITYSQNGFINIRTANNTSIDWSNETNCKNWLDANNPLINYILAEPIDIEITDTTLISQLEAINNAISYEEQTNISGTSSGINPLFDVEAYQSTKLLLENALNRLELLEN